MPLLFKYCFFRNFIFTKFITYLALTEVEILVLRIQFVLMDCFVPRNTRLQRMAGSIFTKIPIVSLQKKRVDKKLLTLFSNTKNLLPNYHSQRIGLVHWTTWFYIKCFIKLRDIA